MPADAPPTVSVVTTAYQAERHVARALRSAAAMAGGWPVEILLFDDGSTDGTAETADRVADEIPEISVIRGGRCGRAAALNRAVSAARGRYVAILDADDIALPNRLTATLPMLETGFGLAMTCSEALVFEGTAPASPAGDLTRTEEHDVSPAALYVSNRLVHSTVLFRRDAWEAAGGYDEQLDVCVDYSFYFRLLRVGGIRQSSAVTCLRQRRGDSYFAEKSHRSYTDALARIRAEARATLPIPLWAQLAATAQNAKLGAEALAHYFHPRRGAA
ncbi:glycosyltransferase [Nisaea acidiphila]|uniref:Glycosyltransferase n=1 Tax=Nisaea acidiphila TaxID=1862145 RepID=A0A9J7AY99_9PROT|nr:glycosyltransferase [Nisaea acidiphila]UUX52046.1 glycosyltransferase [Nisaea acidiphila]